MLDPLDTNSLMGCPCHTPFLCPSLYFPVPMEVLTLSWCRTLGGKPVVDIHGPVLQDLGWSETDASRHIGIISTTSNQYNKMVRNVHSSSQ